MVAPEIVPTWLHVTSIAALATGAVCALIIACDEVRHPQHMWIMNVVWPVTALFGTLTSLFGYYRYGRLATHEAAQAAKDHGTKSPNRRQTPFAAMVAKGAGHCGSGCTLGDIAAEWLAYVAPSVAVWFGWRSLFAEKMFAVWLLDYFFAFTFGIAFQYFTIKPMRNLKPADALVLAVKADALSLTAWQVGMYGFMAVAQFFIFRSVLGVNLAVNSVEFWFMMQIAMICGFLTSCPVNWWLLKIGIKEKM